MKKTITAAVAVFALGATLAFAAPHDGCNGDHEGRHAVISERLAEKLNLSDAQKAQIKAVEAQFKTDNAAFFQSSRQTMQDFRAAKQANDQAKIDALKPSMDAIRAQMKTLREAQREKIRNTVLNAGQRAELDAMKARHEAREQQK